MKTFSRTPLLRAIGVLYGFLHARGTLLDAMKLKLDEQGHVVVKDGKPVYVHDDNKEIPFDAEGTVARISVLNGEAQTHREAKEAALATIKAFTDAGVTDPKAAADAIEKLSKIDAKQLVDAGKIDEVRAAATASMKEQMDAQRVGMENQLKELTGKYDTVTQQLHGELIGGGFNRSKLLTDPKHPYALAIPPDMAQAYFGKHFKVEDGKIVAYGADNKRLYSRVRHGDSNVDFDEALEILIDAYPNKASILRGSNASGDGSGRTTPGGASTIRRAEWNALPPTQQGEVLKTRQLID